METLVQNNHQLVSVETQPDDVEMQPQQDDVEMQPQQDDVEMQPVNAELQPIKAELQPVNAELQPVNAELQQFSAELHQFSAELQPINAELQPVNAELQPANKELQPANTELQPANAEVQPANAEQRTVGAKLQEVSLEMQPVSLEMQPASLEMQPFHVETQPNKRRKKKSIVWEHFTIETVGAGCRRACCKQCKQSFAYSTGSKVAGTSHLKRHIAKGTCPVVLRNQEKNQLSPYSAPSKMGGIGGLNETPKRRYRTASVPYFAFDSDRWRHEIARMIIMHDYPLHIVEHSGFIAFVKNLQPRFDRVS